MQGEPGHWQEGFKQADFQRIYRPKSYSIEYDPDTDEYVIEIGTLNDVVYNGQEQKQEPSVKDGSKTLVKDTDYTLSYSNDVTNVGTVTVTVTGKGNYTGTRTVTYKITKAPLTVTTESAEKVYDGIALTAPGSLTGLVNNETATVTTRRPSNPAPPWQKTRKSSLSSTT